MGLDKIYYTFYRLFGGNEDMEENNFDIDFKYIPAESLFIDGNFIIYQIINEIEYDINEMLKIILAVSHNSDRSELIKYLEKILEKDSLKKFNKYFEEIFYESTLEGMITMLKDKTVNTQNADNILNDIICEYYLSYLKKKVLKLHYIDFINSIYLIFDGIPSGFKIIEQRRRRFKNFLESNLRKNLLKDKMVSFDEYVSLNKINNKNYIFDYGKFVKNMITLPKSFGPSSNIFKKISLRVRKYLLNNYPKLLFYYSGVNENGEADYKIVNLCRLCTSNNIVIHCSDFDFIILGSRLQNESNKKFYLMRHFNENYLVINFIRLNDRIRNYLKLRYNISEDIKIIDDFFFILNIFGNDYIPSINNLSFDNNFLEIIDILGNNLWKNNKYLLYNEELNFNNLNILLLNIDNILDKLTIKNILKNNYYCNNLLKNLPENINSFEDLKKKILLPYWYNNILNLDNLENLFNKDLRIELIQIIIPNIKEELLKMNINIIKSKILESLSYSKIISNSILNENLIKILDMDLKPYNTESLGLKKKEMNNNLSNNSYDNLYYYYYNKSKKIILDNFINLENKNININYSMDDNIVKNYLLSLKFLNFKFYNPMKLTYYFYPYYIAPKIEWILNYKGKIDNIDDYIETENFIDSKLHLIIISPNDKTKYKMIEEFFTQNPELVYIDIKNFNVKTSFENIKFNNYKNINLKNIKKNWDNLIQFYSKKIKNIDFKLLKL